MLLANHLETCVSDAIRQGSGQDKIAERLEALPYSSALTDFRYQTEPLAPPTGRAAPTARAKKSPR